MELTACAAFMNDRARTPNNAGIRRTDFHMGVYGAGWGGGGGRRGVFLPLMGHGTEVIWRAASSPNLCTADVYQVCMRLCVQYVSARVCVCTLNRLFASVWRREA